MSPGRRDEAGDNLFRHPVLEYPRPNHLEEVGLAVSVRERGVYVRGKLLPSAADASRVATGDTVVRQFPVVFTWKFRGLSTLCLAILVAFRSFNRIRALSENCGSRMYL